MEVLVQIVLLHILVLHVNALLLAHVWNEVLHQQTKNLIAVNSDNLLLHGIKVWSQESSLKNLTQLMGAIDEECPYWNRNRKRGVRRKERFCGRKEKRVAAWNGWDVNWDEVGERAWMSVSCMLFINVG